MSHLGNLQERVRGMRIQLEHRSRPQREVTITGLVLQHHMLITGHWWWKKRHSTIIVDLTDESRGLLNQALQSVDLPLYPENQRWIGVAVPETELWRFPVCSAVEVLIGLNSPSRNFYLALTRQYIISARNIETDDLLTTPSRNL